MNAVWQEKAIKVINTERLITNFKTVLYRQKKAHRKAGGSHQSFIARSRKKPPWILIVRSDEFEDKREFEKCGREWKEYEAKMKAEKEAKKKMLQDDKRRRLEEDSIDEEEADVPLRIYPFTGK